MGAAAVQASAGQQQGRKRKASAAADGSWSATRPAGSAALSDAVAEPENEFELQRRQRIERNNQILHELGVDKAAAAIKMANRSKHACSSKPKASTPALPPAPTRRSSRLASQPLEVSPETADAVADARDQDPADAVHLTQEEYFKLVGKELTGCFESDGRFKGWVCPEVCDRYGIAGSASEAWESNGGGKFSKRPDMSSVPEELRSKGWSEAKAWAGSMFYKNPNTYFYRHVAPHETQAHGEWTQEEHELFMQAAKKYGVGDKWGLFASYIPQRVGYQCSAYYRDVVVASGLIIDKRFRMTRDGKAVYVG